MREMVAGACGVLLALGATSAAAEETLACGNYLDVASGEMRGPTLITVNDGTIQSMTAGHFEASQGQTDLSNLTCLPGLMDMHVHLSMQLSATSYLDRVRMGTAEVAFGSLKYARRTVEAGFTTVRDLGESARMSAALRDAIARGEVVGPRIFAATKSIATTGGHADPTNGLRPDLAGDPGPYDGVINGAAEAAQAVRQRYKNGADLIKITATGGVLSQAKSGQNPQFSEAEMEAIVATANDYGMHVAAHAHGAEGMKRALRAGVTTIEHGTFMDDEVIALMREKGAYLVPTLLAGAWVAEKARVDGFFPEIVRPKAAAIGPLIADMFSRAQAAGVNIAFGTDSGVSAHGDNADEFALMVAAGMSPIDAIRSATMTTAELLGVSDTLGTLETDKIADIIAISGNPLNDISLLTDVTFVMKDGQIIKQP